ncbi:MAG: hypothetical protein HY691_00820 [Chloroflexi bacterium]|nr:hypothetical protein [Chloroflexota bacterium]
MIDIDLHAVAAELDFLPQLEQSWAQESEHGRLDWQAEWWDLMGRLQALHDAFRSGTMSADQANRYRALAHQLSGYLPLIRRLGLAEPPVALDEVA